MALPSCPLSGRYPINTKRTTPFDCSPGAMLSRPRIDFLRQFSLSGPRKHATHRFFSSPKRIRADIPHPFPPPTLGEGRGRGACEKPLHRGQRLLSQSERRPAAKRKWGETGNRRSALLSPFLAVAATPSRRRGRPSFHRNFISAWNSRIDPPMMPEKG